MPNIRILALIGLLTMLSAGAASAVTPLLPPTDSGSGIKRGMDEQNQSGQTGWVTLFPEGPNTRIVLHVFSERPGATEFADIRRGSCDNLPAAYAYRLNPVVNGQSSTMLRVPADKLLSWNYAATVRWGARPLSHVVSCGHLYR